MIRFGFNIRTRSGQRVENISIVAQSPADAERRLRQMYDRCQIIECLTQTVGGRRADALDFGALIEMISAAEAPAAIASTHKAGTH
jgi:hypothetical protein